MGMIMNKDRATSPVKHLTEKEAAELYGYSVYWFQRKRWDGTGPPFRKIGRSVRYPADELARWFEAHVLQRSTTQSVPSQPSAA